MEALRMTLHETGTFQTHDDLELYWQHWMPEAAPRANLAVAHGLGEHSGRYGEFAEQFVALGYAVHAFDHRGHGKAQGLRGHVDAWRDFRGDVAAFLEKVRGETPDTPTFLFGHSMGGLIVLEYTLHHPDGLAGVIASGPALEIGGDVSPLLLTAAKVMSFIVPRAQMNNGLDPNGLCHDAEAVQAYREDPLVHDRATPRFSVEMSRAMAWTLEHAAAWEPTLPLLLVHGGGDPICNPEGTRRFFERVEARDKELFICEGCLHESFRDVGGEAVMEKIATWLEGQMNGA
jgi:alpha-beta hydrolase superfamily lysophospholipase